MKSKLLFAFLLAMATKSFAQVARQSKCPNYTTPDAYDDKLFAGRWYEFAKTDRLLEPFTTCIYFEYSSVNHGDQIIVTNQRTPLLGLPANGEVHVTPTMPGAWKSISGFEHRIFATDNNRFAVIHACKDDLFGSSEIIWILTRDQTPDYATAFEAQYYIYFEMERYKLDDLKLTEQENCPAQDDALFG